MRNMMHPQSYFAKMPQPRLQRSQFDRSSNLLTTMGINTLQPIFVDEVLPGDTYNFKANFFARLSTPLKPYMDNLYVDIHAFFVPNRLTWEHWENFQGQQATPLAPVQPTYSVPQMEFDGAITSGSTAACFSLPLTGGAIDTTVTALPFRSIRKIYDDWYRDENFEDEVLTNISDTNDEYVADGFGPLYKRWKVRDYFTGALPWAQKGNPVTLSLGSSAPIIGDGTITRVNNAPLQWKAIATGTNTPINTAGSQDLKINSTADTYATIPSGTQANNFDPMGGLELDLSNITADLAATSPISINDLRTAITLQQYLERDARYGTRYIESLYGRFGVINPDFRLQRAEFISSTRVNINVVPVAQTNNSADGETPQGNLAGFSTASSQGGLRFVKSFTEHGYMLIFASVVADLHYQNGIERFWSRKTKYDFYDPIFANLGEQAILNKEIALTDSPSDDDVFGYQEAWADYRYKPSYIQNLMNSNAPTSVDYWHLAEDYATPPVLGKQFLQYQTPFERIVAVPSEPPVIFNAWYQNKQARVMPVRSIPGLNRL